MTKLLKQTLISDPLEEWRVPFETDVFEDHTHTALLNVHDTFAKGSAHARQNIGSISPPWTRFNAVKHGS